MVSQRFRRAVGTALLACAMLVAASACAEEKKPLVERFTLDNGLEVVIIPNYRVPAVSHMLWFHIGAADDPPLQSGLAHYHEHLMFKGTEQFPQGQYESLIARNGGEQNAFTGHDATGYYVNIAKDRLPLVMELEADRMRGLTPDAAEALKEREVILEERRTRVENTPQALLAEQVNAALYQHHPYQIPVIGWMHEMQTLTPEQALSFHRAYYHPNNAVLVISGDVTAEEIKPLAERYYGTLEKREVPPRLWKAEPPQRAPRRVALAHENVRQPAWTRSYLAPSLVYGETRHALPLIVLAQVLGGGRTGLLYQELVVKQKIATSISADYNAFSRGPPEFSLYATPAEGVSLEKLERAIDTALTTIFKDGIAPDAIVRAKRLLKAEAVYAREGLHSMAYIMGMVRTLGLDVEYFTRWPEYIEAVEIKQVETAAKAVLNLNASVTGSLLPAQKEQALESK